MSLRWTEERLADHLRRNSTDVSAPPFMLPNNQAGCFARGRMPPGKMNRTESAYADYLESRKHGGDVLWWKFEGIKLRLVDSTFYTPDFDVLLKSGHIEIHETKGFWRDDARVKIKVAASIYPFKFIAIKKTKSGWQQEEIA